MINGNIESQSSIKQLLELLDLVLKRQLCREEVSSFAEQYILEDIPSIQDEKLWELITIVSGIDIKITPTEYLYSYEDVKEWIKKFEFA